MSRRCNGLQIALTTVLPHPFPPLPPHLHTPSPLPTRPQDAAKQQQQQRSKVGTSPVVSKAGLTRTPHYKLTMRPAAKLKAVSLSSPSLHKDKSQLFEGLEGSGADRGETFVPRRSVKKLVIKPKPSQVGV